jgi:hypothetical protein
MSMKRLFQMALTASMTLPLAACAGGSSTDGASAGKDATIDPSTLPASIHGKALPLGQEVGVVIDITVSALGGYDTSAADAFSAAIKTRNAALKAANKKLMFAAVAVDAHNVFFQSVANSKIKAQDASDVSDASQSLGLDADTVESQVVLFFNDSSQTLKGIFGKADQDLTVAVVKSTGDVAGTFVLPDDQDAALAALDAALAAQAQ